MSVVMEEETKRSARTYGYRCLAVGDGGATTAKPRSWPPLFSRRGAQSGRSLPLTGQVDNPSM